jgi:large subunit ribosomal protein L24
MHIRVNDNVKIVAGAGKGTVGEGVNLVYRHMKPTRENPTGGRLSKEMPINASNAMMLDPSTSQPTRVGTRYAVDGSKELFAKKSGTTIRVLSKPNPKYAKKA